MRDSRNTVVRNSTAEFFLRDFLMRHCLDHVRSGDEHVRRVFDHDVEVSDRGTVNGAARARSHDATDLRDHAARECVAQKDVSITTETNNAFLNTRAARIIQTDNRRADLHREVHNLANLFRVSLGKGTAKHSEVLRQDEHVTGINQAVTSNHPIAGIDLLVKSEISRAMDHELVKLFERTVIQQELDAFASRHLSRVMLLLHTSVATACLRLNAALPQGLQFSF